MCYYYEALSSGWANSFTFVSHFVFWFLWAGKGYQVANTLGAKDAYLVMNTPGNVHSIKILPTEYFRPNVADHLPLRNGIRKVLIICCVSLGAAWYKVCPCL